MEGVKAYIKLLSGMICALVYGFVWILVKDEIVAWRRTSIFDLPFWVYLWFLVHILGVVIIFIWAWWY